MACQSGALTLSEDAPCGRAGVGIEPACRGRLRPSRIAEAIGLVLGGFLEEVRFLATDLLGRRFPHRR